jgi:hypothetical protein
MEQQSPSVRVRDAGACIETGDVNSTRSGGHGALQGRFSMCYRWIET